MIYSLDTPLFNQICDEYEALRAKPYPPDLCCAQIMSGHEREWTGKQMALCEIVYALAACRCAEKNDFGDIESAAMNLIGKGVWQKCLREENIPEEKIKRDTITLNLLRYALKKKDFGALNGAKPGDFYLYSSSFGTRGLLILDKIFVKSAGPCVMCCAAKECDALEKEHYALPDLTVGMIVWLPVNLFPDDSRKAVQGMPIPPDASRRLFGSVVFVGDQKTLHSSFKKAPGCTVGELVKMINQHRQP